MITPPLPHGLIAGAQRRLSPSNDLASPTLLDGLHGKTFAHFAGLVRAEAAREAERPSFENLPESVYDPGAKLERQDSATGQRFVEFRAQRSFIADMKPPTIRAIIADPRTLSGRQMISRDVLLPESVYDPGAKLERQDSATGQRFVEFRAQRSFIADMKPPTIRAIIADPRTLSGRQMISRDVLLTKHPVRV